MSIANTQKPKLKNKEGPSESPWWIHSREREYEVRLSDNLSSSCGRMGGCTETESLAAAAWQSKAKKGRSETPAAQKSI